MTSRTGHVMATATLQPVEERLRQAVAVAAAAQTELVDGQPQPTSPQRSSTSSADSKVIHRFSSYYARGRHMIKKHAYHTIDVRNGRKRFF